MAENFNPAGFDAETGEPFEAMGHFIRTIIEAAPARDPLYDHLSGYDLIEYMMQLGTSALLVQGNMAIEAQLPEY